MSNPAQNRWRPCEPYPANSGCAIFVGNEEKVFVIQVEHGMGAVIGMFLRDTPKERPLTHDLIASIFGGFNITVERVVITELKSSTYFARLILQQQNELGRKIVEIDARPSDCIALATALSCAVGWWVYTHLQPFLGVSPP